MGKKQAAPLDLEESLDQRKVLDDAANEDLFGGEDVSSVDVTQFDDGLKKKKKSKKVTLDLGEGDDELVGELDELSLDKKKKKKSKAGNLDIGASLSAEGIEKSAESGKKSERPWLERDMGRDGFLYEELLERVYAVIHKMNPASGESAQKLVVPPPKLARIGTKKTAFSNFEATAKALNRKSDHLLLYIFAELGTTGNQDASGGLILKGKFVNKAMEKVLKAYCKEYVQFVLHQLRKARSTLFRQMRHLPIRANSRRDYEGFSSRRWQACSNQGCRRCCSSKVENLAISSLLLRFLLRLGVIT